MAVQVGLGATRILLLIGTGLAGSILVKNGSLTDFLGDTYRIFAKHLKKGEEPPKQNTIDTALISQVNRLRQELSHLSVERSPITVISGSSNIFDSFTSIALPALFIGATGYGYMKWKGLSLSDFMYVTRRSMSDAITTVAKQLEQVSSTLAATKRQLTSRLEHLNSNLDESIEIQEQLKDKVKEVHGEVSRVGIEIETVQQLVKGLEGKISSIQSKQELTNNGVIFLCKFVQNLDGAQRVERLEVPNRPRLERAASSFGGSGVRGLQYFSEVLTLPSSSTVEPESETSRISPVLRRNPSMSIDLLRSSSIPRP